MPANLILNYTEYLQKYPIHDLFNLDRSHVEDYQKNQALNSRKNVEPKNSDPLPPELDDLIRLHYLVISRKVTTVLEFGSGKSTLVFADAIKRNKESFEEFVSTNLRKANQFEVHSIENNEAWLERTKSIIPVELQDVVNIHLCASEISHFNGRLCSYYQNIPNICPDLIYLDGPDQFSSEGTLRGLSTAHPDRMPMAADILSIEHFLTPGTFIVVDGRTANARFIRCNFQRDWFYQYDSSSDQHFFELIEEPLGIYNRKQIQFCLGQSYFERLKANQLNSI